MQESPYARRRYGEQKLQQLHKLRWVRGTWDAGNGCLRDYYSLNYFLIGSVSFSRFYRREIWRAFENFIFMNICDIAYAFVKRMKLCMLFATLFLFWNYCTGFFYFMISQLSYFVTQLSKKFYVKLLRMFPSNIGCTTVSFDFKR